VADLYAQIDVLLAPSTWPESYGLVSREALAANVVEGENGHIVDVTSYEGVAQALSTVDTHPDTYRTSPKTITPLREVTEQVVDLVRLYEALRQCHVVGDQTCESLSG
jgi:glycosyltransferase involved in cell wall biosynthesis